MEEVQFSLYHMKDSRVLKIERHDKPKFTVKRTVEKENQYQNDEVVSFNDRYYICKDRKKLKQFALELKDEWIEEAQLKLKQLEDIKI